MGLLQPTNVSPSMWGEIGSGVVTTASPLAISWQVNGDVPMTAYQIYIYVNDALSTQKYTTGKVVLTEPFYGLDYNGNIVRFMADSISASTLSASGITNGNQYKIKIVQWWGTATDNEKVEQSSMSVFLTRSTPTLTITNPGTISTRSHSFTATYAQAEGDSLNYVRWKMMWYDGSEYVSLKDTGNLYGVSQLQFDYDGFFTGQTYSVYCEVQTQNGATASVSVGFIVEYSTQEMAGTFGFSCKKDLSGMKVKWPFARAVPGYGSNYAFTDDEPKQLQINPNGRVGWNTINGSQMNIGDKWFLVWKWTERYGLYNGATIANVSFDGMNYARVTLNTTTSQYEDVYTITVFEYSPPSSRYITVLSRRVPKNYPVCFVVSRAPHATITGRGTIVFTIYDEGTREGRAVQYTPPGSGNLHGITIYDGCKLAFCAAESINTTFADIKSRYLDNPPTNNDNTILLTHFNDSTIDAGNYNLSTGTITGYDLYRADGDNAILKKIATLDNTKNELVDCSAPSQENSKYYVFVNGTVSSSALISDTVTPVFWDWAILECTQAADKTYHPVNIFLFGKNLTSGTITNNNSPNLLQNFTRYPTIQRATQNYMSGTLQSYIGTVDPYTAQYTDTLAQRDAISNLSTTSNALFLKNRKGDIFPIQIAGAIGFTTLDGSREQALNASVPWAQVGEIGDKSIILTSNDSLFPES